MDTSFHINLQNKEVYELIKKEMIFAQLNTLLSTVNDERKVQQITEVD